MSGETCSIFYSFLWAHVYCEVKLNANQVPEVFLQAAHDGGICVFDYDMGKWYKRKTFS